jgi:hypothetical protein
MVLLADARAEHTMLKQKLAEMELKLGRTANAASRAAEANEPILQKNVDRKIIFPLKHPDVWKMVRNPLSNDAAPVDRRCFVFKLQRANC